MVNEACCAITCASKARRVGSWGRQIVSTHPPTPMISAKDVFQEQTHEQEPVVVDFDLLEAAKENVQPLATGRRVTALSQLLATPHSQREGKLLATRHRLRINV